MFKPGDEVIINTSAEHMYIYTRPGSRGRVIETTPYSIIIEFYFLNCTERPSISSTFNIDVKHVSLLARVPFGDPICNKIRQMEERQSLKRGR
jgi:hypothetical protein